MISDVFDMLFGCSHDNYSFPISTRKDASECSQAARVTGTYVVCLDCGKEFPYDWNRMKILSANAKPIVSRPLPASPVGGLGKVA